ncbi:MAG: hypothetical protein ACJ76J_28690 [Thermoanaerobaculia bacterium]
MLKLILMALSLLLWGSGAGTEKSASAGYGQVFEAAGPGWDPDGSPAPQGDDIGPTTDAGPGWDPDGLK